MNDTALNSIVLTQTKLAKKGELDALYTHFYHDVEDGLGLSQRTVFKLKH